MEVAAKVDAKCRIPARTLPTCDRLRCGVESLGTWHVGKDGRSDKERNKKVGRWHLGAFLSIVEIRRNAETTRLQCEYRCLTSIAAFAAKQPLNDCTGSVALSAVCEFDL